MTDQDLRTTLSHEDGSHVTVKDEKWLPVLSVACGAFVLVNTEFLPIGLLTPIAESLKVSAGAVGLAVTVPGAVAAISAPILMLFGSGFDRRKILLSLTAIVLVSNVIAMLSTSLTALLAGRILLGIGVGGFWTFAVPVGRRLVSEAAGSRATSIITAGISIGTVLGVPAGALIGNLAGWRVAFIANALLTCIPDPIDPVACNGVLGAHYRRTFSSPVEKRGHHSRVDSLAFHY